MKCLLCGAELIWGGDHDDECVDPDIVGSDVVHLPAHVVTNLLCPQFDCPVDFVLVYQSWPEGRERWQGVSSEGVH